MRFVGRLLLNVVRALAVIAALAVVAMTAVWYFYGGEEEDVRLVAGLVEEVAAPAPLPAPSAPLRDVSPAPPVVSPTLPQPAPVPVEAPKPPPIPRIVEADDAARELFPEDSYLLQAGTRNKPKNCDDLKDALYFVNISDKTRSTLQLKLMTVGSGIAGVITFGISELVKNSEPYATIFKASVQGKYVTLLLGAPRGYWDDDVTGPQRRVTYYIIDSKRLGLIEDTTVDAPPFKRPATGALKPTTIFFRCVYRSDASDNP